MALTPRVTHTHKRRDSESETPPRPFTAQHDEPLAFLTGAAARARRLSLAARTVQKMMPEAADVVPAAAAFPRGHGGRSWLSSLHLRALRVPHLHIQWRRRSSATRQTARLGMSSPGSVTSASRARLRLRRGLCVFFMWCIYDEGRGAAGRADGLPRGGACERPGRSPCAFWPPLPVDDGFVLAGPRFAADRRATAQAFAA